MNRFITMILATLIILGICSSCDVAINESTSSGQSESLNESELMDSKIKDADTPKSSGNESQWTQSQWEQWEKDNPQSSYNGNEFEGSEETSKKKLYKNLQDIVDELSKKMKELNISKDVNSLYIPELFVNAKDQFPKMNPKVFNSEETGSMDITFNQPLMDSSIDVGKYEVFSSQFTCFEQAQDIKSLPKERGEGWRMYTYDGKYFAVISIPGKDYGFGLWYCIDEKNQVLIVAVSKDKKSIDTEEKAVAVFKDFSCITIGEALQ